MARKRSALDAALSRGDYERAAKLILAQLRHMATGLAHLHNVEFARAQHRRLVLSWGITDLSDTAQARARIASHLQLRTPQEWAEYEQRVTA